MSHSLDVTICFFGVYDAPGQTVEVVWQMHNGAELPGGSFPLGRGPTSQVIRNRAALLIKRWATEFPPVQVQYATDRAGLPESAVIVPVIFDERVVGVLAVESYDAEAYDEDDLALIQNIADQTAVAMGVVQHNADVVREVAPRISDLEAILASMSDALLVLDDEGRLVRLNQAARQMLCLADAALILGHPVDRPQAGHWPLGTQDLTQQLQPIIDRLRQGDAPAEEVRVARSDDAARPLGCRASILMKDGLPAGGLMVLREIAA
jgi:PAS domain-containing protein